ncbi:hypothetical protein P691DRAFT_762968 [Macrolepiota fuliginosa MF-IS2]|uniref:Uncharacterized protein n=1 Tax=Macrolepiota fuliginosa MF-IS2 TaxID=1400762 RepID=A0A9P5X5J8_9AGAR|nr:hypothetical protein P691DRAFT_762968 [Macrolepiota fuliginosa MF-IS2]
MGFNLGLKSQSELRNRAPKSKRGFNEEEEWYIPYTGSYEPPPEPRFSKTKNRDSWGDPIFGLGNTDELEEGGSRVAYDYETSEQHSSRVSEGDRIRARGRSFSVNSAYTTSTGVDHGRPSYGTRQSNMSSTSRPPIPSYVNMDIGGVGESPMPHLRPAKDRPLSHRASLASIFTFGVKQSSTFDRGPVGRSVRPSTSSGIDRSSNRVSSSDHRRSASGDTHGTPGRVKGSARGPMQSIDSHATTDEDYYNSYYSTLLQTPVKTRTSKPPPPSSPDSSPSKPIPSTSHHPYALVLPELEDQSRDTPRIPKSAPPSSTAQRTATIVPKLTFSESHPPSSRPAGLIPNTPASGSPQKRIKGSASTPNLASAKNTRNASRTLPRGIDRWLSAETWCDALLFPRPRLKIKNEGSSTGRIVSPPGSPLLAPEIAAGNQVESVPSRVLAHSRSLVSLREAREEDPWIEQSHVGISLPPSVPTSSQTQSQTAVEGSGRPVADGHLRPPRPKSWAQDDLDLPSPVPSLAKVLEDGERLVSERKEWQDKAQNSLGNKQARNISRSRSKSLTAKGRKASNQVQGNMDFLAARAVHGNQDIIPVLPSTPKKPKSPSHQGTTSYISHSRNNSNSQTQTNTSSLIRSFTRSSKSHSREHSRNDSWSKSALKVVKSTAAPCCDNDATITPTEEKQRNEIERAMQANDAKVTVTQLANANAALAPGNTLSPRNGPSPTPSGVSSRTTDPRVGIAISTPLTDESYSRENIRLPSHPYAQGGQYSYNEPRTTHEKRVGYAGPHPIQPIRTAEVPDGPVARHKLPPHVTLSHPYAQAQSTNRDSYDGRLTQLPSPDNDVPPHAKMWAPLAPGVVREVLPAELKYSPFIGADGGMESEMAMAMAMSGIVDTVSVGEALAYAAGYRERERERGRDSGLGTSEDIHGPGLWEGVTKIEGMEGGGDVIAKLGLPPRAPVQYDVTRPIFRLHQPAVQRSPETAHTFASSPLEHYLTPRIPGFTRDMTEVGVMTSPIISSEGSSQRNSPRPLGSPTDLVGFQDLFYKPGSSALRRLQSQDSLGGQSSDGSQTRLSNIPFDLKSPHRRSVSGLTTLARKLSEEYEQLSIQEPSSSQHSRSSGSLRPPYVRRPTEGSLEFVFEEMPHPDSPTQGDYPYESPHPRVALPFGPEKNIPEDVSASSVDHGDENEEDENETEVYHIKQVETATPAAVDADHRLSFAGQMEYQTEHHDAHAHNSVPATTEVVEGAGADDEAGHIYDIPSPTSQARVRSGLHAPLTDATRSSYLTTSTMSRMSNLSDFPIPPANHRMSLLEVFFNDVVGHPSILVTEDNVPATPPPQTSDHNNRLTFGAGADAEDIVDALSNHPSHF